MQPSSSSSKLDRNAMEKKRRLQMKDLASRLATLIPKQPSKKRLPLPDLLDQAIAYVKQQKQNIDELERIRNEQNKGVEDGKDKTESSMFPVLAVRDMGSALEVNLITGLNKKVFLHEVCSVLEEEGAEAVSASYSTVGDKIFYTIYYRVYLTSIYDSIIYMHEQYIGELDVLSVVVYGQHVQY
ncbi:hypothetical protein F0562_033324 [Nyssa sinensis]|uniref:BHLH domain-containing protein n=1 Tax=Nyssa sinensis TaxID=561372 RepID=A0A5J5AQ63_9ASTE|nr:hypothetical protein F0562_033324 [Nyssa sinensis]